MNAHTLVTLISRVRLYEHNLFISIYILHRGKFIHAPDNTHLSYIIVYHIYLYFSAVTKKIYLSSLSYMNSLRPFDTYMCQESNVSFVKMMAWRMIGDQSFSK